LSGDNAVDCVEMSVPEAGAILAGKYALHRRLGAGGYGAVYEGENIDLGKRVAIKLISRRHAQSEEAVGRFRREARASAKIESANIVQVFDVGADPEAGLYMVMELLRGEDLRRKLDRAGKLDVLFAVDIAHQIACGLAKAHAVGVVHRDLKPANIFLHQPSTDPGSADEIDDTRVLAKIVDFGVAKLLDEAVLGEAPQNPLTVAGKTVGTPQYMSPEQVQGQPFDHRGDLWALGTLLHEMLTGKPAFAQHDTFQQTALAIVHSEPEPLGRDVPRALGEVVRRALQKEPNARFADATTFAEALMNAVPEAFEDERAAARAAEIVSVHPRRPRSLRPPPSTEMDLALPIDRRRTGVIVAITVLAAAAMILVRAAANKRPPERPPAAAATATAPPVVSAPELTVAVPEPPAIPSVVAAPEPTPAPAPIASPSSKPIYKAPEQFGGTGVTTNF
jgi:eukaryotic-like serine/threonine-protein kinase